MIHIKYNIIIAAILLAACRTNDTVSIPDASVASCDVSCQLPNSLTKAKEQIISQDNWSFKLSNPDWVVKEPPLEAIKIALSNDNMKMMILLLKEEIGELTYPEFVVDNVQAFVESGAKVNSIGKLKLIIVNLFYCN